MKLYTDDIVVNPDNNWLEIPLKTGGTYTNIVQTVSGDIYVRVGSTSTSKGVKLNSNDQFKADGSIFVKNVKSYPSIITVIRNGD